MPPRAAGRGRGTGRSPPDDIDGDPIDEQDSAEAALHVLVGECGVDAVLAGPVVADGERESPRVITEEDLERVGGASRERHEVEAREPEMTDDGVDVVGVGRCTEVGVGTGRPRTASAAPQLDHHRTARKEQIEKGVIVVGGVDDAGDEHNWMPIRSVIVEIPDAYVVIDPRLDGCHG